MIDIDEFERITLENYELKTKNQKLIAEKQELVNENVNLKMALKKTTRKKFEPIELISEYKRSENNGRLVRRMAGEG